MNKIQHLPSNNHPTTDLPKPGCSDGEDDCHDSLTLSSKDYFDLKFLKNYFQYLITHKYVPSMKGYIEPRNISIDAITNDEWIVDYEEELTRNPGRYYEERKKIFKDRVPIIASSGAKITEKHIAMLADINAIFKKHNTNFRIVISPLWNQREFNKNDLMILQGIFGKEFIYDFSGKNDFTCCKEHYYETSHYRTIVGESIMSILYRSAVQVPIPGN